MFTYGAWGHARPLCNLASKIVQSRSTYITLLTSPSLVDKVHNEIGRSFGPDEENTKQRIRFALHLPPSSCASQRAAEEPFHELFVRLLRQETVQCALKLTTFEPIAPPSVAILDFFGACVLRVIRELAPSTKIYAWQSGATSAVLRLFGPKEFGGMGDLRPVLEGVSAKTGQTMGEVLSEMKRNLPGELRHMPGLPPMYDYEDFPQEMPVAFDESLVQVSLCGHEFFQKCDGVIQVSDPVCDPGVEAMERWQASFSPPRKVYNIGPQFPTRTGAGGELALSPKAKEIVAFLDSALQAHGLASVVYISFGTLFGPWAKPDGLWAVLDVLMENKVPFIFSHASPMAVIPDSVAEKVKNSGVGVLSQWSPQQDILSHPATGWFLTHAGYNSAMEGMSSGIPMICWDFSADQPLVAATLSSVLDVAYQLFEVRTGPEGLRPIYRTGKAPEGTIEAVRRELAEVLDKMRGEDGARKRENVKMIQQELTATVREGGRARQAFVQLLDDLDL
ncbi:UDP-Glycosyltransferase/glycogen phosphorylase [Punctularia strigosozonata HHB-11173 SS5]|uniref:UDP-Glycosyltransferase/glycogen phosphorylase n=1 Tax=Punctularia strigosozonata (strain HHB-11173) TaxID=741275 RepID=UPI0004416407|nr:UDP-Glycosyltransferase/glycogen phosphorylase [Punctularia strigosozonata HHB-11173 SS5]EIN06280.1 UDP-Glycosyltransferase/glycogen phosphorylase [Punctularia strigosozonata HHB-11173 SS5]